MQQDGGRADVQFGGMHDDGFHCGPGRALGVVEGDYSLQGAGLGGGGSGVVLPVAAGGVAE
ncbi:hypothetical protein [Mycobacterium haemophilum]|uniref:Uncharacterized protein n=1 Tax=Mycobacterium haemophilum TaxID=29311 RepID=A0A0I9TFW5_9MYCO|nr:hypothetical protein [Mycobacterium haemophilum]KLO27175.1 hypothetical protein ABH39_16355 [Mycobacterium haemophilum]KLO36089.1 hypothetical protein ABH37_19730 [Mycobacterium haemophilum]KLO38347.1 hypothetical protein ABH38_02590 [Mycobacterium haemophilum]KLO44244.1 hypothetical protein ABH36_19600 [Mycobacterium haemophilum]